MTDAVPLYPAVKQPPTAAIDAAVRTSPSSRPLPASLTNQGKTLCRLLAAMDELMYNYYRQTVAVMSAMAASKLSSESYDRLAAKSSESHAKTVGMYEAMISEYQQSIAQLQTRLLHAEDVSIRDRERRLSVETRNRELSERIAAVERTLKQTVHTYHNGYVYRRSKYDIGVQCERDVEDRRDDLLSLAQTESAAAKYRLSVAAPRRKKGARSSAAATATSVSSPPRSPRVKSPGTPRSSAANIQRTRTSVTRNSLSKSAKSAPSPQSLRSFSKPQLMVTVAAEAETASQPVSGNAADEENVSRTATRTPSALSPP